jgi:hypothetical protein
MSDLEKMPTKETSLLLPVSAQIGNLRLPGWKSLFIHTAFNMSSRALNSGTSKPLGTVLSKAICSGEQTADDRPWNGNEATWSFRNWSLWQTKETE